MFYFAENFGTGDTENIEVCARCVICAVMLNCKIWSTSNNMVSFLGEWYLQLVETRSAARIIMYNPQRSPGLLSPLCGQGIPVSLNCIAYCVCAS